MTVIIDAEGMVMGRMATRTAKELLKGEKVEIINAEKAVISGNRDYILDRYYTRFERVPKGNPTKGPHYSRMPDRIIRSAVRNMLPKYSKRGRMALKSLKVWIGNPPGVKGTKTEVKGAKKVDIKKFMSLGELSRVLGAKF